MRDARQFSWRDFTAVAREVACVTVCTVVLFPNSAFVTGDTLYRSAHLISSTTVPLNSKSNGVVRNIRTRAGPLQAVACSIVSARSSCTAPESEPVTVSTRPDYHSSLVELAEDLRSALAQAGEKGGA